MKIHSVFQSINGEVTASHQGSICTFLRLQGCNMRCVWCDTKDSQRRSKGVILTSEEVYRLIKNQPIKTKNITITGGEPLLQKEELYDLALALREEGYEISLETNGSLQVPFHIHSLLASTIMDFKPESSGIGCYDAYLHKVSEAVISLGSNDWVKCPVMNQSDLIKAILFKKTYQKLGYLNHPRFAFSAIAPLTSKKLYNKMIKKKIGDVVLNVQLHKMIGVS